MRRVLCLALSIVFCLPALSEARADDRPARLRYMYAQGGRVRYRISFRRSIDETSEGQQRTFSARYGYEYQTEVQTINAETNSATLKLNFTRVFFDSGSPDQKFDSSNPDQLKQAKNKSEWSLWAAALSSTSRARVTELGRVDFVRFTDVSSEYGDSVRNMLDDVLVEVGKYLTVALPDGEVKVGQAWEAIIPIRVIGGGALNKTIQEVEGRFVLERVDTVDGERRAVIKVSLAKQPELGLTDNSIKGMHLDFGIGQLEGVLVFSISRGNIVHYSVQASTHYRLSFEGDSQSPAQVLDDHRMDYEVTIDKI